MVTHFRLRLYLLALMVLAGFSLLLYRLYAVQINDHAIYVNKLPGERFESIRIPGVRGEIKDRNGITLAENVANYEMRFNLKQIKENYIDKFGKTPKYIWNPIVQGQPQRRQETDIVKIIEEIVQPELGKMGLLTNYSESALRVHYRSTDGVVPYVYRRDLTFEEFAMFSEKNLELPGVTVTASARRHYVYDSLGSHYIGYVNLPDIDKVSREERYSYNYYVGDDYGVHGVEKKMDSYLQGEPGKLVLRKNEKGRFIGEESYAPPKPGGDVYLTIDARIQMVAEESLRKIGRGAAVVMDPRSGEILAMASVPSFNPNEFVPNVSQEYWDQLNKDRTNPLFNRAINQYSPGSVGKIPVALAGCLTDSWKYKFPCAKGAQYGSKFMKCWCYSKGYSHGTINVSDAIKFSCNGFFYRYANDVGIKNIKTMTDLLGLGRTTGIEVTAEQPGNIPDPKWLSQQGLQWSDAFTALVSIGQGATETTPLQMASVTSSLASGGKVHQPLLVHKVVKSDNEIVLDGKPQLRHDLTEEGLTAEQVELVKRGMWRVVNDSGGTARRAASEITVISGKTGTVQTGNPRYPTNAWFISFAPYDEPELAVCVFVENGNSGGGAASPIAKNIIDQTMAMRQGKEVELVALKEAEGHFGRIMSVSFDEEAQDIIAYASDDDSDTAVDVNDFVPQKLRPSTSSSSRTYTKPSIKPKADRAPSTQNETSKNRWKNLRPFSFLKRKR